MIEKIPGWSVFDVLTVNVEHDAGVYCVKIQEFANVNPVFYLNEDCQHVRFLEDTAGFHHDRNDDINGLVVVITLKSHPSNKRS